MTSAKEYIQSVFETVKARNGHEAEFLQAVEEFFNTLEPVFENTLSISKKISWHVLLSLSAWFLSVFLGLTVMEKFK